MDRLATFNQHRRLLFSIAYRMLGSVTDAEDMLQEAFIRWQGTSDEVIRSPRALLVTIVTRLCINQLESARARREQPVGQWLPEPLPTTTGEGSLEELRVDESISMALLLLLERLTPSERAVFVLHEVFGFTHAEIARYLGQTEVSCRKLFSRARQHVGDIRRRFEPSSEAHEALLARFIDAARNGNVEALADLFAKDVVLRMDAGASHPIPNAIHGIDKVMRAMSGGVRNLPEGTIVRGVALNGEPGIISYANGRAVTALIFDIRDGLIVCVYIISDAKKLAHLPALEDAS